MRIDGGSNVCLVTTDDVPHNMVPHVGSVTGTGEIKAKVTAHGDLILIFALGSWTFQATTTRCYVMTSNRYCTLGLAPFRWADYKKAVHDMHNRVQNTLDSGEVIESPISVVLNHLDYTKIKILPPGMRAVHLESHRIDQMVFIAAHRVRMNEVALNHTLTVHEKGLHS